MKIEMLDNKTVKVLLSKLDMNNFNMTYDEMDYKSPDTKRILIKLLDEVKQQINLDLTTGKLFIEAFPYADGGCILYVNLLDGVSAKKATNQNVTNQNSRICDPKIAFDTPIVCAFKDLSFLTKLCERMLARYGHMILKSSLYLMGKKYYLILYTYCKMDKEISKLMSEYGNLFGKGAVCVAMIFEHGKELIAQNAIELLVDTLA